MDNVQMDLIIKDSIILKLKETISRLEYTDYHFNNPLITVDSLPRDGFMCLKLLVEKLKYYYDKFKEFDDYYNSYYDEALLLLDYASGTMFKSIHFEYKNDFVGNAIVETTIILNNQSVGGVILNSSYKSSNVDFLKYMNMLDLHSFSYAGIEDDKFVIKLTSPKIVIRKDYSRRFNN